jgi:pimeloyl-ACP methyl ester carboxylesterase
VSTYLMIHGAWQGAWCWRKVIPLLEASGHTVLAPDLPGHGDDTTPPATVTLKSYADHICQIAGAQSEPVILVGHSMGGVAITQAAENYSKQIGALVYMCAYLPRNGDSLTTWGQQDPESLVGMNMIPKADGVIDIKQEAIQEALYASCSLEDSAFAQSHFRLEPGAPFGDPVTTTAERWGRIPRYYIECLRDRAITLKLQQDMQKHSPCRQTFSIDTDHSPFFSAPEQLASILLQIGSS